MLLYEGLLLKTLVDFLGILALHRTDGNHGPTNPLFAWSKDNGKQNGDPPPEYQFRLILH